MKCGSDLRSCGVCGSDSGWDDAVGVGVKFGDTEGQHKGGCKLQ